MNKRKINVNGHANEILEALPKGILLTTKAEDRTNSMVIGWATLGVNWNTPVIAVYVREGRFTREQLDKNPEFTVNIPVGDYDKKLIGLFGSKSGYDMDKHKEAGVTLVDSDNISVPGIKEFPLTLECKVMYRQKQELPLLSDIINAELYPQDVDSSYHGANKDAHVTYYGEIVDAYIIEG